MAGMPPRLRRRIEWDFPDRAPEIIRIVGEASDCERSQAAIVLHASGDLVRVRALADLARIDWRDVLMGSGLEHDGWENRLDASSARRGRTAAAGPAARREVRP